jgi:hypothetical protein
MLGIDSGPRATPEAEAIRVAAAATDDRPSIAELQRIEGAMTVAPWDSGEDPRDDGEVCDPNLKCVAKVRGNVEANTVGIAALRNAAPVLLEIAAAALAEAAAECTRQEPHWDYVEGGSEDVSCFKDIHCKVCPVAIARELLAAALAKVREYRRRAMTGWMDDRDRERAALLADLVGKLDACRTLSEIGLVEQEIARVALTPDDRRAVNAAGERAHARVRE